MQSTATLKTISQELRKFNFPDLKRPHVAANQIPTLELVEWGAKVYGFSWLSHLSALLTGVVCLLESDNIPAARVVARSVYEVGAHVYYVKKHVKQHLQVNNCAAVWDLLTPIATGSRYINDRIPEESELFPLPAHIKKMINCFSEVMPQNAQEDYSYLSEFSHPNVMAFMQHYFWSDPGTVKFSRSEVDGFLGATTAAVIAGLLALRELLGLAKERDIRQRVIGVLNQIVTEAEEQKR